MHRTITEVPEAPNYPPVQQLTYLKKETLEWREVPAPRLRAPDDAIVRPFAAARCDLDCAFLFANLSLPIRLGVAAHFLDPAALDSLGKRPFRGPFPFGHECVAEVTEVGPDVKAYQRGDRVIVPFQVSCGRFLTCWQGLTARCQTHDETPISAYGFGTATGAWGGAVSEAVRVPHADELLVRLPAGVDPVALASASDNLPDGYRAVAPALAERPGAHVLVVGGRAQSVGMYAVACALALGAASVDYVDHVADRLDLAERLGARPIRATSGSRWYKRAAPPRPGGYPVTVDASSAEPGLRFAIGALAPGGICTSVGFYFRRGTPLPLWRMYLNGSTLRTGLANVRADLPDVLALVTSGRLDPAAVTTLRAPWAEAPRALLERTTKVVLERAPLFGAA